MKTPTIVFDCPYATCVWPDCCMSGSQASENQPRCWTELEAARRTFIRTIIASPRKGDSK